MQIIGIVSPLREGGIDCFTLPMTGGVYVVEELVVSILSFTFIALFDVGLIDKLKSEEVPATEGGGGEQGILFCVSAEMLSEVLFVAHCRASKSSRAFCPVVLKHIVAHAAPLFLTQVMSDFSKPLGSRSKLWRSGTQRCRLSCKAGTRHIFAGTEYVSSFTPSSLTVCMYNKKLSIIVLLLRQLTTSHATSKARAFAAPF
jgi:hypothetical protein